MATDQIARGLTQPWDNTVAKSARLAPAGAENVAADGPEDAIGRTGGFSDELDTIESSEGVVSGEGNTTSSKFTGTINESAGDETVGYIERTGDPAEYSAGKAARSVISSTFHFVNEFVLGLTGYSLNFWAGLAVVIFGVMFLAKEGYLSRIGISKSNMHRAAGAPPMANAASQEQLNLAAALPKEEPLIRGSDLMNALHDMYTTIVKSDGWRVMDRS